MNPLDAENRFASISIHDLVEARDAYHLHLLAKPNVVGTAIGRYLQRDAPAGEPRYARTLFNSSVRPNSWPCVLVFVRNWEHEEAFGVGHRYRAWQMVPKTLYMPDGRVVPVCVVETQPVQRNKPSRPILGQRPKAFLGGGLPICVRNQNVERFATAGSLVTDGHTTYVLTARHACGDPGTPIFSRLAGGEVEIGCSSPLQLTRKPFSEVYPDFPSSRTYSSLDVGLVRLHDASTWSSNTYGLPRTGALADVHEKNLSLRLIDQAVVGFGAASGFLEGTIKALFYRHRSVGGYEYVADFLIAPKKGGPQTKPGDSGMIWHLDLPRPALEDRSKRDLRPLAIEWGGQIFEDSSTTSTFAVATSLSNVFKLLDVELITDAATGVSRFWGRTGHYSIAAAALGLVGEQGLERLVDENLEAITFDRAVIQAEGFDTMVGQLSRDENFVPLADVPDEVWKHLKSGSQGREGGRDIDVVDGRSTGPEHPIHYADIDIPIGPNGETLRALCLGDPEQHLTIAAWRKYYEDLAAAADAQGNEEAAARLRDPFKKGILPFRIWQLFDVMKKAASERNMLDFVAAAGVAAHYVGDACQPLHGSQFSDGDESRTVTRAGQVVSYGKGVHFAYESQMVALKAKDLLDGIAAALEGQAMLPPVETGKEMALAVIKLMDDVARKLDPMRILDAFEEAGASSSESALEEMWQAVGDDTIAVMALGARSLASLWQSAWMAGGGSQIPIASLGAQDLEALRERYNDKTFARSLSIDRIDEVLS